MSCEKEGSAKKKRRLDEGSRRRWLEDGMREEGSSKKKDVSGRDVSE